MYLYLVQHGEAKSKEQDPDRSLTARGAEDVRLVAQFARRAGVSVSEIRHSGKRRAEQTAEILADHLGLNKAVRATAGLDPNDDVAPVAVMLENAPDDIMIVGHLPFLSRLASYLLADNAEHEVVRFQMGGIVCLERCEESSWRVAWMATPDLLRGL